MNIGVPKEIQPNENRISITPQGAETLIARGHTVYLEKNAGIQSGFEDAEFAQAGVRILDSPSEIFGIADLIVKVREPRPDETPMCRSGQIVFSFFNFLTDEQMTRQFIDSEAIAIAYETVESPDGSLPLLLPMSEIAGRLAVQQGAHFLERGQGGRGVLLGGTPGVPPGCVMILGGGIVGTHAARIAAGMGAEVFLYDIDINRLRYFDQNLPGNVTAVVSNGHTVRERLSQVDLLIGAVRIVGDRAPMLVTQDMVLTMKKGSVIVDVSVDEGGCVESIHPTTLDHPTYVWEDVIHYGVTNMPSAVPFTSTQALTNVTLPSICELADKGFERAFSESRAIQTGVNIYRGKVTREAIAKRFNLEYTPVTRI